MKHARRTIRAATFASVVVWGSGLALAQQVRYDYDKGADFSKFKTYKWVDVEGAKHPNQLTDQNIRRAIDAELAKKSLTVKDADPVDLFVGYQVSVDQETQITGFSSGPGARGAWGWGGTTSATTSTINIGTLVLDVYDPAKKQLVWRGNATKTLNPSKDPAKNQARLEKAVAKLLENYPPPAPEK